MLKYPRGSEVDGQPPVINQAFGANPERYAQFLDAYGNPQKGHMGIDFAAPHGTPVLAAHDGYAFYVGPDSHGGDGVYVRMTTPASDGKYYTTIYWHLIAKTDPELAPTVGEGKNVKAGDVIGYSDNTGAPFESSGDHLHFGLVPCDAGGAFSEPANGYGGCIDPQPFFDPIVVPNTTPVGELSASDQIAVIAAKLMAAGKTYQANIIFAFVRVLKAFNV